MPKMSDNKCDDSKSSQLEQGMLLSTLSSHFVPIPGLPFTMFVSVFRALLSDRQISLSWTMQTNGKSKYNST